MSIKTSPDELFERLSRLNKIGVALSAKEDLRELLEMILLGAKELTYADAGTLYLVTDDKTLRFEIVSTDSLDMAWGGVGQECVPFPEIPLFDSDGSPNDQMVVCYCALSGKTLNIPDAYNMERFNFTGTRQFDVKTGYRSKSFLNVPLKNYKHEVIGVLQLLNRIDPYSGDVVEFSEADERLVESMSSQAAVALSNRQLVTSLNGMLEGFIEAMAHGVDQQSRYTGDHCRRVPVIANLLAQAVNRESQELHDKAKFSERDLHELHIASLLHDCGKVATPIHVTDKSTRQEVVFDQIHHIRTRFELKKKDVELEWMRNPTTEESLQRELDTLDQDFNFLEECNRSSTYMDEEKKSHVREIAEKTWMSSSGERKPLITEHELINFLITRGTLNDDERNIINNHVVSSIEMLKNLPYPDHLARVPEIAGAHHEWVNGQGYPNSLTGEDMSLQARILCIADVFEALTAHDRPYKPPMPLSKALSILRAQVEKGHLDGDLVETLVKQGVHIEYAEQHLNADQMDIG
jgi:HD-GYP domain-containing protein (c-di-GMP phosphodiesterase class II)